MKTLENASVWSPLEIRLQSTVKYEEPYLQTEIEGIFIHESGKEIKVPGFWYDGNIWAVRFTPEKEGKWSYRILCADKENKGLHAKGSFAVKGTESPLPIKKHGFITDRHNKRFFTYDDGTPFFWLGDTHWQAPNYETVTSCNFPGCACSNQFKHEVDNRAEKGFTVYQTYFDSSESDGGGQIGALPSIWEKKFFRPSAEQFKNKIDYMFEYLDSVGMCAAVGFGVHIITAQNMKEEDFFRFVRYLVARYGCYCVVWLTAQEITRLKPSSTEGKTTMDVYMDMGAYIAQLDGYHHPLSAHMDVMDVQDERAMRLSDAAWHTYWITQGGHGMRMTPKKSHYRDYIGAKNYFKPVVEGELSYEDLNCGSFVTNKATRVAAWNAYFNGCAGYTYGATGIWANGYSNDVKGWMGETESYSNEPWFIGLDKPGSFEMAYLKNFFINIPAWETLVPDYYDETAGDFLHDEKKLMMRNENTVVCYFRNEDTSTGSILKLDPLKRYTALWYNPLTGNYMELAKEITGTQEYILPQKPNIEEWAVVLTAAELKHVTLEKPCVNGYKVQGEVIKPVKVTAQGGVYYQDGKLIDHTAYLYDGREDTVWKPCSNHVTQTVIYDLGKEFSLGGIAIAPSKETVLPPYRVMTSVDGSTWQIQANTVAERALKHCGTVKNTLCGKARYVKVVFDNTSDITKEEAETAAYKVVENNIYLTRMNVIWYYPATELIQITVFGG